MEDLSWGALFAKAAVRFWPVWLALAAYSRSRAFNGALRASSDATKNEGPA